MKILKEVLSLPTASFHEEAVAGYIKKTCKRLNVNVRTDKFGNILVHYKHGKARQPVIFTAHMDHPGFEVVSTNNGKCVVAVFGRINLDFFANARVLVKTASGIVKGRVGKKPLKGKWKGRPMFEVVPVVAKLALPMKQSKLCHYNLKKGDFGWYDVPNFKIKGDILYTKAADDLASVAALLELLQILAIKKINADVRCLFSRAEEVGFIGSVASANQKGFIPNGVPVIVMECSSAKAGHVQIGGGPVIRVGDKLTSFDPAIDCWLKDIAKDMKVQRALLSGGTCEASVWMLRGRPAGGLAFPLGNYHNDGERSYEPEYISLSDYKWMQKLLIAVVSADRFKTAIKKADRHIMDNYKVWRSKL